METRNRAALNISPSKQQFSFPKSARFLSPQAYTNAFGYEIPGYFGHKIGTGANRGFNSSQTRFSPLKNSSTNHIEGPPCIDRLGNAFSRT